MQTLAPLGQWGKFICLPQVILMGFIKYVLSILKKRNILKVLKVFKIYTLQKPVFLPRDHTSINCNQVHGLRAHLSRDHQSPYILCPFFNSPFCHSVIWIPENHHAAWNFQLMPSCFIQLCTPKPIKGTPRSLSITCGLLYMAHNLLLSHAKSPTGHSS